MDTADIGPEHELGYLGLGANVGSPQQALEGALARLAAVPGVSVRDVSRLYRTRPVGPVAQADFLNAAAAVVVPAGRNPEDAAMTLLVALKEIERALGRVERERWGPREVDLDILVFGDHRIHLERHEAARSNDASRCDTQWLEVPHPSARERLFVLAPLADLAPDMEPPGWDGSVEAARERALAAEGADSVVPVASWDPAASRWRDGWEAAQSR